MPFGGNAKRSPSDASSRGSTITENNVTGNDVADTGSNVTGNTVTGNIVTGSNDDAEAAEKARRNMQLKR